MRPQKNKKGKCKYSRRGFTLIEALIAVAIFGILASLAYPSYQYGVRKAKRAEARAVLMELMQQQERFYLQHTRYIVFSSASTAADEKKFKWFSGAAAKSSAYEIDASACNGDTIAHCVLLTATPGTANVDSAYRDPECGALSLSSAGVKLPAGRGCW